MPRSFNCPFPSGYPTKPVYACLFYHIRATCHISTILIGWPEYLVTSTKFLVMQFSRVSFYVLPLGQKRRLPQHTTWITFHSQLPESIWQLSRQGELTQFVLINLYTFHVSGYITISYFQSLIFEKSVEKIQVSLWVCVFVIHLLCSVFCTYLYCFVVILLFYVFLCFVVVLLL